MPRKVIKLISFLLCVCLLFQQTGFAQVAGQLDISGHILSLRNSFIQDKFRPLHLRYLSYDNQANNFRLLLDKGDFEKGLSPEGTVPEEKLKEETKTLLNYFFIGISLPNDSFWVNLRPDSENEVIDPELGRTDVGKILLEADLQLKKDTAKFTSPETLEGKKYWAQLYKKAEELFGYENITIPTLTRPWIVPDEIIIRETQDNAYIYKATLKVMLEQDYLKDSSTYSFKDPRLKALNEYSSQLIRELIIPKLTKEINSSKRYAPLRQVYYSLILAQWFKQRFYGKGGLYSWLIDKKNLNGLTSKTPWSKTTYFQAYQKSFKEGEYNLKEPTYTPYGQTIRSYFSGGLALGNCVPRLGSFTGAGATQTEKLEGGGQFTKIGGGKRFLLRIIAPFLISLSISSASLGEVKVDISQATPSEITQGEKEESDSTSVAKEAPNLQPAGDKTRYPYKRDPLDMFIGADSAVLALKEKLNLNKNTTIDFYNQLSQKLIQELKNNDIDHTKELSRADKYLITVLMFKIIEEANFEIKDSSFSITLTPQFKTPVDCDLLSFIFLKMAYDLDLPLHFILMPGHAALVWSDKDITFDIDPRWELQDKVYETFFKPLLEMFEKFKKAISPQKRPDLSPEKRKELIEKALEKALADPVKNYLSMDEDEHNKDRYRIELNQHELEGIILFTEVQNLTAIAQDPKRFGITDFKTPYQFRVLAKDMYKRLVERSKQPECQALYAGFYINSLQELYWIDKDAGFFKNQEEEVKAWKEIEEEQAKYMKFLSIGLYAEPKSFFLAPSKPLTRGKETYGYELNGQITIDADKARRLFSAEFNDLKQAFARQRGKTADTLIEEELKELSNRFTGFIHVHEIFHQLIREANLSLEKDKEEALANILAKIAFGIASPAEIQEFEKFIQQFPQGSQLRNQLTQLKETRYDDLTNSFLVNLTRLGVEYTQNINISTISGSNIPEGAKAMSKAGEEESRSRVLFKDTEEDTEEIAYVKPIKLTLSPNMEGSLTLWIYKFEDIPDTWPVKYRINRNVGYFIIKENGPADEYKGLRDGEEVILGRYNPGRFEGFGSGFISRSHVKISRKKDTIVIEDTSTHGTLLEWVEGVITKQPRDKSVQQIREMIGRENLPCTNGRKDLVLLNGRVADERLNEIEDKLVNGGTIDQSTGGFLKKELEEIRQEISLILQLFKRFSNPNYRERLGLLRGADNGEVKKQYRKLMLEFHPDRYGNDERPHPISQHVAAEIAKLIGEAHKHTYSPLAEPGRGPGGGSRLESPNNKVKEADELLNQGKASEARNLLREAIEVYNAIIKDEKDAPEGTLGFEMRKAAEKNLEVARELLKQAKEQIKTQPPADTEKESPPADASSVTSKTADNFSEEELSISYIAKNDFQRNETYRNERYKERLFIPMMLKKLFKNYEAFKGKKMLELGCGPHTQTIDFLSSKGIDITGVDVLRLVEHPLVKKADMYEYLKTLKDKSLDVIYSSGVFEIRGLLIGLTRTSFTNYDKFKEMVSRVLTESKRVLKDDGYIIVYVYEKEAALSEKELKELGFTIIESEPTISSNYIWVLKKADEKSAQTNQGPNNISSDKGGIDGSTGSPSTPETGKKGLGGVDFRGLPIVTQPMQPPLGIVPLGAQVRPLSGTVPFINLDEEWSQIERMLNSGIIPSSQRIKEYLEVSCSSQDCSERIDRVLSGIADILRLEEERVSATEPALREMLVLLESDKPASAIQTALSKITVAPKEPALVK